MGAWHWWAGAITTDSGEMPELIAGAAGSWNLFSVLGVEPVLGRTFTPEEDRIGANNAVILSWSFFQSRFNGDRSILGKTVRIDSMTYTIVGVLPQSFTYPAPEVKVWIPFAPTFEADQLAAHDRHQSYVIARFKKDGPPSAAIQEVSALQYQIHLAHGNLPVAEDSVMRPVLEDVV